MEQLQEKILKKNEEKSKKGQINKIWKKEIYFKILSNYIEKKILSKKHLIIT